MGFFKDWLIWLATPPEENQRRHREKMAELQKQVDQRYRSDDIKKKLGAYVLSALEKSVREKRDLQFEDADCRVTVKVGFHRNGQVFVTDILVYDRKSTNGGHWHVILDEETDTVLHKHWRTNK